MSLETIANQFEVATLMLRHHIPVILDMLGVLYAIQFCNWILGYRLCYFGILPRRVIGLPGILFSPFIHGNFNHLFFNSIPFVMLACLLSLSGWWVFAYVTVMVALLGGFATWLLGRPGLHVGASGVIMGYWSYLLITAYYQPSWLSIALALVCLYYFGSFLFNALPTSERSSWEGHLFGLCAGIFASYAQSSVLPWLVAMGS